MEVKDGKYEPTGSEDFGVCDRKKRSSECNLASSVAFSGPIRAVHVVAPRKSMRGCWRKGE